MNICIDQGNSRTKIALFRRNGTIHKTFMYKHFSVADVERLFSLYSISDSIISSVVNPEPSVVNALHRLSRTFILFDHTTPVPLVNHYETPETLGLDRLAAAVGAVGLLPGVNLLIIDVGTAITYDFVDKDGGYYGGNIAPGIKMRLHVLKQMTKKLPLIEVEEDELLPLFGKNTRDAIAAGVIRGVAFETKGYIRTLEERVDKLQTIITGGYSPFVVRNVQSNLMYEKHLVLKGLNKILEYNKPCELDSKS